MSIRVIVGAQWGDEGKGKIVDILASQTDFVVRYQGGANAGHTLKFDDRKVVLHLIPSGIFNGDAVCVIGNGVVIDPIALNKEIQTVEQMGVDLHGRLLISDGAHVILAYHKVLDKVKERSLGSQAIGTTGRGIGPAYVSKVSRMGIRIGDLLYPELLVEKIRSVVEEINPSLVSVHGETALDADAIYAELGESIASLKPYIANTTHLLLDAVDEGAPILLEGAQGSLLDVDHGTYPYVTSSNPTSGGACTGTGIPPRAITDVMGITKAYCTRVGNGPFPSEQDNEIGQTLREQGQEFGATTGRPRRCGWLDLVALRYAVRLNGMNELALTKLDVLDGFETIEVCTAYRLDGQVIDHFPQRVEELERLEPIYESLPGWKGESTRHVTRFESLPANAQAYVKWVEERLGVRFTLVSTGPKREETIDRR